MAIDRQQLKEHEIEHHTDLILSQFSDSVIENVNVWLNVLDNDSRIVYWNATAERLSGYKRDEVLGVFSVLGKAGRHFSAMPLSPGDVVRTQTGGGGDFGPCWERDPNMVLEDVIDGYVSHRGAELDYGVVLRKDLSIDEAATATRRKHMQEV